MAGRNRQDLVAVRNCTTGIVVPVAQLVVEAGGVADWSGVSIRSDAETESKSWAVISPTAVIAPTAIVTASTGISANAPIETAGWCGERAATADVSTCRRGEAVATSCVASAESSVSAAMTGSG